MTGNKDEIYSIAKNGYYAYQDDKAPGGYVHSGGLLIVDKNKHFRGVCDGTHPNDTKRLIKDIKKLIAEQF